MRCVTKYVLPIALCYQAAVPDVEMTESIPRTAVFIRKIRCLDWESTATSTRQAI